MHPMYDTLKGTNENIELKIKNLLKINEDILYEK